MIFARKEAQPQTFCSPASAAEYRALLVALFIVGSLFLGATVLAPNLANAKPQDDFGAETIEIEDEITKLALPLSEVEESIDGSGAQTKPAKKGSAKREPTPLRDPGAKLDPTQILGKDSTVETNVGTNAAGNINENSTTVLNVKDADIATLVKTFSKLLKRNYIVDSNVKGKVTIHLAEPVTVAEALKIFDSVLLLKGFTTVPIGGNVYKVIPAKDASQTTIPLDDGTNENPSDTLVTQLIRLKNVQAADMQQLLSQFVSKEGVINSFSGTNSLIIIDSQANIERLRKLLREIDVPAKDQEITVIPVLHAEVKDISEKVKDILGVKDDDETGTAGSTIRTRNPGQNSPIPRPGGMPGMPQVGGSAASRNVEASRTLPLKLIPDERTNSIIVVADTDMTTKVRALVEQLDSPVDLSGGKFYVYRLKFAKADELSETLSKLISGTSDSSSTGGNAPGVTGGSSITRGARDAEQNRNTSTQSAADRLAQALARRRNTALTGGDASGADGGKVKFEGEVAIAPDVSTNSLIINASRGDYTRLKELIDALDVKRPQVFVEATILEVSLSKSENLGISLQSSGGTDNAGILAQSNLGGITDILTNPSGLRDLTIAAASTGTITLPGGIQLPTQAVVLRAASRNDNVNVLSAPTILTTDNQEAEIIVGQNIPFVTNTSTDTSNLQNTFNQIQRQDVGIKLKLTPQISSNDFVTLKIFVEISNVVAGTQSDANGPTTTIRTTETTVAVKSGQMIVTGGLISDDNTSARNGIPYLQDIPVLGNLFSATGDDNRRTNLLVFITPKIINDQFEARENTVEKRDLLSKVIEERKAFPDRKEILQNDRIDNVAEQSDAAILDLPSSTIMGPRRGSDGESPPPLTTEEAQAIQRTEDRIKSMLQSNAQGTHQQQNAEENKVIDITVSPKLPAPPNRSNFDPRPSSVTGASTGGESFGKSVAPQRIDAATSERSYVVLRAVNRGNPENPPRLPFSYVDALGTVGIVSLGGVDSSSSSFFAVGSMYSFKIPGSDETLSFVCLGKFASLEEARAAHASLAEQGQWYNLTPQDVLMLGRGPWLVQG